MYLFWTLLQKDLRRIVRNPMPLLILLGIPLAISSLIGLAFGGGGDGESPQVAPIRLGVIDYDASIFTDFMRGAGGQSEMSKRIKLTFLEDEVQALEQIQDGELSAVLIIPKGFTDAFVSGADGIKLELIKNPAEYIYPTLAQEGAEVVVTLLNALVRNFQKDLKELHGLLEEEREFDFFRDVLAVSTLIERTRNRLDAAQVYLNPPLVSYQKPSDEEAAEDRGATSDSERVGDASKTDESAGEFNLFAYLLIGMAAMFMLMIADNCMRDLYKELRFRTLERFRTLREGLWLFIGVKVLYTVIVLLLAVVILLGVGSVLFGFGWQQYGATIALVVAYSFFGAGFMGFIAAVAGKERRADMLNTMIVIILSAVGGAMWPTNSLPPFVREFLTPISPVYWFSNELRVLQMHPDQAHWMGVCGLLMGSAIALVLGASLIFRMRLERGIKQ